MKKLLLTLALMVGIMHFTVDAKTGIPADVEKEGKASVKKGVDYLLGKQNEDGSWSKHPAVTGLCLMALKGAGMEKDNPKITEAINKGKAFVKKFVQKDGSIWIAQSKREYPNYTTAIALCALAIVGGDEDEPIMRKARKYLIESQITDTKHKSFGGIGYGSEGPENPDLSNTQWALEALYLTEYLDKEPKAKSPEDKKKSELAWKNAVQFLSKLQHAPETNDAVWVVKDKDDPNYGSFVYKPDGSKSSQKHGDKDTLRGYGSMTYAGLKSMIYAKLKKDDPRVKAAIGWGAKNYTFDENPGMGPEGHFYYLHTFAKAHSVYGGNNVVTPDGKKHNWRVDLVKKLIELQKEDGHWVNENGRWWESLPQLVTAYSLLSMESALGIKKSNNVIPVK